MGKKTDLESWSEKFLLHGKQKGYEILVTSGSMSGMDKISPQDEYENAHKGDADLNEKIIKLSDLNELAYEDLILSINTSSSAGKNAFELIWNAKSADFSKGNCKIAWGRMVSKFGPCTASSLLKLKVRFATMS